MALLENQLKIKRSQIPGAGKGLFTTKPIKKGERIVEYKGKITTWKEVNHRDGTNGYIFYVTGNRVIDAGSYLKAFGRYTNDAKGLSKVKGLKNNAQYVIRGANAYVDATRNIEKGEEILVGYGKEYWDVMKSNSKL